MKLKFKKKLEANGFSVSEIAKKCGVERNTIYSFGRGAAVSLGTIRKIAAALGMTPSELLILMGE
jgi:transcriptional regulator with XRE-family HTH domain